MELLLGPLLFLLSAYFSATETAVYRANWIRLTEWAGRRVPGAGTALRDEAHTLVRIPMAPGAESLNAAVAASVLIYEARRRALA